MNTDIENASESKILSPPKQRFFVFVRCLPGSTYDVGLAIAKKKKDLVIDVSSTSGEWDLLLLVEATIGVDIGVDVANLFQDIKGISRTNTIAAYRITS